MVASIGPTGSFLPINRYFFVFVRSFETHAGAGVVFRWLSEIRSKADMNDATGEVRLVPEAVMRRGSLVPLSLTANEAR